MPTPEEMKAALLAKLGKPTSTVDAAANLNVTQDKIVDVAKEIPDVNKAKAATTGLVSQNPNDLLGIIKRQRMRPEMLPQKPKENEVCFKSKTAHFQAFTPKGAAIIFVNTYHTTSDEVEIECLEELQKMTNMIKVYEGPWAEEKAGE